MNKQIISKVLGGLMLLLVLLGAVPLITAINCEELVEPWVYMNSTALALGILLIFLGRKSTASDMGIKEGIAVTSLSWLLISAVAGIGIFLATPGYSFIQGWFEAMSGLTTTGSSIFGTNVDEFGNTYGTKISELTNAVLLWRSVCHWIGGIGIVVISLAVIPLISGGGSGFQMYQAEVPGLSADKLAPRIASTARILLSFYILLTGMEIVALRLCGIDWFDSVCHTFATVSTGGFSTFDDSVEGLCSHYAEWVIIVVMFLCGINFTLLITALKGKPLKIWKSLEARVFISIIIVAWAVIIISLQLDGKLYQNDIHGLLRDSLFQVVSLCTSTGFGSGYDTIGEGWNAWHPMASTVLVFCMITGACAGSTAGGMKVIRTIIAWLGGVRELRRFAEPTRVTPVVIDGQIVPDRMLLQVYAFVFIFALSWIVGTILLVAFGQNFAVAASASLSGLSNMGPGVDAIGSSCNFGHFNNPSMITYIALMLLGRLEFFGVLIVMIPKNWKK